MNRYTSVRVFLDVTSVISSSTIPSWEQLLILNEDFSHLSTVDHHNVVILFEVSIDDD